MPDWMQVALERDGNEITRWKVLQDSFEKVVIDHRAPTAAAMYSNRDTAASDEITFYVSPGAWPIFRLEIELYGGEPTERPAQEDVSLLVGHGSALDSAWVEQMDAETSSESHS